MAKSEGAEVRHAMDGPEIEHDQLIGKINQWNLEDGERASSAAETRSEIGQFTEKTGMNAKALSMLRQIKKTGAKNRDKAMDIIRSIEAGLPMVKADLGGQQSEMDLDADDPPETFDPDDAELNEAADSLPGPSYEQDFTPGGDAEIAEDADDFDRHLAEVEEAAE
jgi:hypothetical protein